MRELEGLEQAKGITPAEALESLKRALNFADWPLREQTFVAGFSPLSVQTSALAGYSLEHETLLPVISTWVGRDYFFRKPGTRYAFELLVIVGQQTARDVAEALLLQIVYSQMKSEPRVELNGPVGDVAVYRNSDVDQSIAFVRNNIGISIENYNFNGRGASAKERASEIDKRLKEMPTVQSLVGDKHVPRILQFKPSTPRIHPGEKTDLDIEIADDYPPTSLLFQAKNGSYNQDPKRKDDWYFRAGPRKGSGEVVLKVVNDINLMAESRCSIQIE